MQVHELTQGSQEWLAFRATHYGASEAAAMLGLSKTMTRPELLHMKATGLTPEFTAWLQKNVLDHGHHVESLTLPLIEQHIGDDLYSATCSEGKLSASCDGLTMSGDYAWENKQPNVEIVAQMRAGVMPEQHTPQCQQVLMVTGAKKLIFSVCDGSPENLLMLDVWPDTGWFERLRAGWAQFEVDLAAYEPPAEAAPAPTGRAPETLPGLLITVRGEVTDSNLANFKDVALAAIRSVNRDLQNDQDFADAEKAVKWCDDIEKRVAGAKQHALSQTATIDSLFKTMDDISAEARQVRLDLEKLVKARKVSLKTEMLTEAQTALADHIRALNTRLGRDYMPPVAVDFAGAITNKRNFDSMRAALDATLANAKIAANATADKIDANLKVLREQAADFKFLFADTAQIVLKAADDLQTLVKSRIAEHQAEVARKEEETRERIRQEEKAKLERAAEVQARIDAFATVGEPLAGRTADEIRSILATIQATVLSKDLLDDRVTDAQAAKDAAIERVAAALEAATPPVVAAAPAPAEPVQAAAAEQTVAAAPAPAANVVPMRAAAPAPAHATPPTLKLGQIAERLGFALTGDFLKTLGFEPAARDKSALLFHEADFTHILAALVQHIGRVQAKQAA